MLWKKKSKETNAVTEEIQRMTGTESDVMHTPTYADVDHNPSIVGYNTIEEQQVCFGVMSGIGYRPLNDTVLDIGCGFGDFYGWSRAYYLQDKYMPKLYVGVEYMTELAQQGIERYGLVGPDEDDMYAVQPHSTIINHEFLSYMQKVPENAYDWVMCSGALNYALFNTDEEQLRYLRDVVQEAFRVSIRGVALNFYTNPAINGRVENSQLWSWHKAALIALMDALFAGKYIMRADYLQDDTTIYIYKSRKEAA